MRSQRFGGKFRPENKGVKGVLCVDTNDLIPREAMKPTYTYVYEFEEKAKQNPQNDNLSRICHVG